MRRWFFLLSYFLVMFSLASNMVAGVFICSDEIEIVEKEKAGEEVDKETDFEKDKIYQNNIIFLSLLAFRKMQNLHPDIKIASLALDAEINPPDNKFA